MKKGGEQTFKNTFFLFTEQVALTSHGVAVRPKITNTPPRTSKCLPWGGSSPKYTTCLPGCCLMCVWIVTKERKKKKNKPLLLPRIARHSNRTQYIAFLSVALVITAALTGDRRRECVCVCLSPTAVPSGGIFELFFIYSAACCSFSLRYGELGQSRAKTAASVEDDGFSPGVSTLTLGKYTCRFLW